MRPSLWAQALGVQRLDSGALVAGQALQDLGEPVGGGGHAAGLACTTDSPLAVSV